MRTRIIAVVAILLTSCLASCDGPPPTDAALVNLFHEQRANFELLRSTICAVAPQTIWPEAGHEDRKISPDTSEAIRVLMAKVGATRVASLEPKSDKNGTPLPCYAEITVWSAGMLDSGDSRSFEYAPRQDSYDLEVSNLETIDVAATVKHFEKPSSHGHRLYKRHLEGIWWLTRSYWE
jgi:hypothetical protein